MSERATDCWISGHGLKQHLDSNGETDEMKASQAQVLLRRCDDNWEAEITTRDDEGRAQTLSFNFAFTPTLSEAAAQTA